VVRDFNLDVGEGEFVSFLGPSGCGKTTTLRMVAGFETPTDGRIRIDGRDVVNLKPSARNIGMVFQSYALFPNLTVAENVGFRLFEEHELTDEQIDNRIAEVLGFVGLTDFADRMPAALSGGQRRRVGIARAMASKPRLLLFDDPITGLDPLIASSIDDEIVKLRDLEDVTTFVVTHQIRDAFYIAEHRAVTVNGANQQVLLDWIVAGNYEFKIEYRDSFDRVIKSASGTLTAAASGASSPTLVFSFDGYTSTPSTGWP